MVATMLAMTCTLPRSRRGAALSVADFIPHAHAAPRARPSRSSSWRTATTPAIIGNTAAPYINTSLVPEAALMTNSHAIGHPSQPNYLALFSGSTQGVTDDSCPHSFSVANLGSEALAAGKSFAGYSESMLIDGFTGCSSPNGLYARKHNPWVNFTNVPASLELRLQEVPEGRPRTSSLSYRTCATTCMTARRKSATSGSRNTSRRSSSGMPPTMDC